MKKNIGVVLALVGSAGLAVMAFAQSAPPHARVDFARVDFDGHGFDAWRGDRPYGFPGQSRSETVARNGMVATGQSLAAEAGLEILHAGGNAFDAAVATAAALNVVEPGSAGIGGDAFVIAWSAKDHKLIALDGSGRAPSGATPERFTAKGLKHVPYAGIDSAVVPGAIDAWDVLLKAKGTMTFKQVLEPAARIADEGFGLTERISNEWNSEAKLLAQDPESARVYLPGGKAPALYEVFRNPGLAKAFRLIETGGRDAYYKGPIAQAVVKRSRELGGTFSLADFDRIHARWVEPISTNFNGYDIWQMPPSTQGFAVLEMMNILEVCPAKLGLDPATLNPKSADYWHIMVEAKKLAYDDLETYDGDPDYSNVPVKKLISKEYAAEQCGKINLRKAIIPKAAVDSVGGTVYLTTADRWGNVVSFIYSVYGGSGSGLTVPGYGFLLNNRAALFRLDPKSPNVIAPGKRPFYTIIPGFVTRDGKPLMSIGVMYGDQQAQGQAQVLANILKWGANPQAAGDAARFSHNQRMNRLALETELFDAVGADLKARGQNVVKANGLAMGGYQAIMVDPHSGVLRGASDSRKDGQAVGY
jgi:gamma-glutamyltranspeptidase/glutathione hydrolase